MMTKDIKVVIFCGRDDNCDLEHGALEKLAGDRE